MKEFQLDEVALLRGFYTRDKHSINKLHGLIHKKFNWFAYKFLRDREKAHDAVTEAFIALLNTQDEFVDLNNMTAWIYNRVRWNCFSALKPKAGQGKSDSIDNLEELPDENDTVEERQIKAEVYNSILQEIEKLSDRNKKILKFYYLDEMTTQEIAAELGMNIKTVHNTRRELLKIIRNELIRKSLTILILGILLPIK